MNATTNQTTITGFIKSNVTTEPMEGTRFAQSNLLSELPGLVFCLLTLGYIVSSLIALA